MFSGGLLRVFVPEMGVGIEYDSAPEIEAAI
jgi:hypothetical protein